jgi:hypothetical protein
MAIATAVITRSPIALTDTTTTIRTLARHTDITGRSGSLMASSWVLARGMDGAGVAAADIGATTGADAVGAMATAMDIVVAMGTTVDTAAVGMDITVDMATADTAADTMAAGPMRVEATMAAVDTTVVAADTTAAVAEDSTVAAVEDFTAVAVVDFTAVEADMAVVDIASHQLIRSS